MKNSFRFYLGLCLVALLGYGFHLFSKSEDGVDPKTGVSNQVLLPDYLLDVNGNEISKKELDGKFVGLYFSASWCGPCRSFTPKLISFRDQHIENFEVILVGSDGSAKAQANYMKKYSMPWLALKNQSESARNISLSLDVEYIPYLVILDSQGKVITKKGQQDIETLGTEAFISWQNQTK